MIQGRNVSSGLTNNCDFVETEVSRFKMLLLVCTTMTVYRVFVLIKVTFHSWHKVLTDYYLEMNALRRAAARTSECSQVFT